MLVYQGSSDVGPLRWMVGIVFLDFVASADFSLLLTMIGPREPRKAVVLESIRVRSSSPVNLESDLADS
jgi:hypothetical protein